MTPRTDPADKVEPPGSGTTFMPVEFVDTNILVYAYDQTAGSD